jgi:hypothetical protein
MAPFYRRLCVVAALLLGPVGAGLVRAESVGEVALAANRLTHQANDLRDRLEAGQLRPEEALRQLGGLLPQYDEVDRRALVLCQRACSAETVGEAADIVLNGSIAQSLYALTLATTGRFPPERGYAALHDIIVAYPELRHGRTLADPQPLVAQFAALSQLPKPGAPWISGPALRVDAELRQVLPAWASDTGSLVRQMDRLAEFLRLVMEEYDRTRDLELIAVHLMGKLHWFAGYSQALAVVTKEHAWAGLAQGFEALAQRATCNPQELTNVFTLEIRREDTRLVIPAFR